MSFPVVLSDPMLVLPAAPTPRETKRLSDIDDQEFLRHMQCYIAVYRGGQPTGGNNSAPAAVIRRAVAEALVPYYPLAGWLREMEGRKLVMECTGEGVLFVEAEAGIRLEEVEADGLRTLFPWLKQLMSLVEGSSDVLHCPLLHIQMTRFKCGGFVLAVRFNHTMCDGVGFSHFISTVAKLAHGGRSSAGPSPELAVAATWARELLDARLAPNPAFAHREYDDDPAPTTTAQEQEQEQEQDLHTSTFSFSSSDIAVLKKNLPPHLLRSATVFQVVAAFIWRCRSMALSLPPNQDVRLVVPLDLRLLKTLRLPAGYYGNAVISVSSVLPAGSLCSSTLGELVQLLQQAKKKVTAEYVRSVADMLVLRGRPNLTKDGMFLLTDLRHIGFHRVDFGWGKPVYSGFTAEAASYSASFLLGVEDRVVVPLMLPSHAMERFSLEAHTWLQHLRSASRL